MIKFSYDFDFPITLTYEQVHWWKFRSEMKAYTTLIENTPYRVDALVSLHLQWININDYEVEYGFGQINFN